MGGLAADYALDRTGSGVNDHPLIEQGLVKPATDADKPQKSLLINLLYHETDLIGMGFNHNRGPLAFLYCDQISQLVYPDLVHIRRDLLFNDLLD